VAKKKWFRIAFYWCSDFGYSINLDALADDGVWEYDHTIMDFEDKKPDNTSGFPEKYMLAALRAYQAAGILCVGGDVPAEALQWLRRHKIEVPE